ncbi:MAG TPA: BON domain-containing protein [Gemmatimonadales bacterium]|jgi:osmotically-inducible protein OsmY|nr:BON domain-containing protein [Gemmatimonadales bacterium]
MRTDYELRADIIAELGWDPSIRDEDIATAVKDAVVTLAGTVDTYAQRYAAERAVERVRGVKAIVNDLTVKLPGSMERSDADIAHAAVNALRWNVQVPSERIQVRVSNGWLTLEGEVDGFYQKDAAERSVRSLMGVKGLTNLITLRAMPTPGDIKQRIRSSLKRQAELDADEIAVETEGSRITLRGTVRSMAERRDAERAAWNAPGVTRVDSEIKVYPFVPAVL